MPAPQGSHSAMATRVLPMSARLGPMQQPDEPVFAQLKPVLGAREAAMFTGEDLKQQPGGGGGARMPAEEMVQVRQEKPLGRAPLLAVPLDAGRSPHGQCSLGGAVSRGNQGGALQRGAPTWEGIGGSGAGARSPLLPPPAPPCVGMRLVRVLPAPLCLQVS